MTEDPNGMLFPTWVQIANTIGLSGISRIGWSTKTSVNLARKNSGKWYFRCYIKIYVQAIWYSPYNCSDKSPILMGRFQTGCNK